MPKPMVSASNACQLSQCFKARTNALMPRSWPVTTIAFRPTGICFIESSFTFFNSHLRSFNLSHAIHAAHSRKRNVRFDTTNANCAHFSKGAFVPPSWWHLPQVSPLSATHTDDTRRPGTFRIEYRMAVAGRRHLGRAAGPGCGFS